MRDEGGRALQDLLLFPALQSTSPETKNDRDSSCRWLDYVLQKLFRKLDVTLRMLLMSCFHRQTIQEHWQLLVVDSC